MESGLEALQRTIAEAKSRPARGEGAGGDFPRLGYFNWKNGEAKVLRFLTDDINQAMYAEFVLTKDGKSQNFLVDPSNNLVEKYGGKSRESFVDPSSALVDPKLVKRAAGVAVLREERPAAGGGIEIVDNLSERTIGGQVYPARYFGIVRQALRNFWPTLVECASRYGTLTDRDYVIKRMGGGVDTQYSILPCDPIDGLRTTEEVQAQYGYGRPWNAEDPDRLLYCPQTIQEWVEYYGGEDRIRYFLGSPDEAQQQTTSATPMAATPTAGTDFASLRDRLTAYAK